MMVSGPHEIPGMADASERLPRMVLVALFVVAVALQAMGFMVRHEYEVPAVVGAEAGVIAQHIVHGDGFASPFDDGGKPGPSTHLPPAYPYLLAGLMKLGLSDFGVYYAAVGINLLAGGMLAVLTLLVGEAAGLGRGVSLAGAMLMCFCPEAFREVALVWDAALFAALSAAFLWWILRRLAAGPRRRDAIWMGTASGILAMLNPAMVLALPAAWLAGLRAKGWPWRKIAAQGLVFLAFTLAGSAPWNARNWFALHPPAHIFIRGNFWLEVWSASHPLSPVTLPDGEVVDEPLHPWNHTEPMTRTDAQGHVQRLTEQQYFAWCRTRMIAGFAAKPGWLISHVARQINAFWLGAAEAQRWHRNQIVFFVAQGIPAMLGIAGLILARRRMGPAPTRVLLAVLLIFPLPYYFAGAGMRYRHPIDVVIYLGIALLFCTGLERWRKGAAVRSRATR